MSDRVVESGARGGKSEGEWSAGDVAIEQKVARKEEGVVLDGCEDARRGDVGEMGRVHLWSGLDGEKRREEGMGGALQTRSCLF